MLHYAWAVALNGEWPRGELQFISLGDTQEKEHEYVNMKEII